MRLDAIIAKDPMAVLRVKLCYNRTSFSVGEITTQCYVDIHKVVRETIREIGYTVLNMDLMPILVEY